MRVDMLSVNGLHSHIHVAHLGLVHLQDRLLVMQPGTDRDRAVGHKLGLQAMKQGRAKQVYW